MHFRSKIMEQIFRETKKNIFFGDTASLDFPPHLHEDLELIYARRGGGTAYCNGYAYPLKAGSLFLAFPNQVHHYVGCKSGGYLLLILKPSDLLHFFDVFLKGLPKNACYTPPTEDPEKIGHCLEEALAEHRAQSDPVVVSAYLTAVFGKLLPHLDIRQTALQKDCFSSILAFCAHHYLEPIGIEDLADELHISRSHISHIFSSRLHINFCDYLNSLRLQKALNLLQSEHISITEIASQSGFSTIRTFNRAFQKHFGASPSQYRRQNKEKDIHPPL